MTKKKCYFKYNIYSAADFYLHLPTPTYPLRPPRFLTRNIPDFLSPQFIDSPKSVSKTHVELTLFHVIPAIKKENKKLL